MAACGAASGRGSIGQAHTKHWVKVPKSNGEGGESGGAPACAADEARQPAEPTRPRARGARQYESHQEARAARASYAVAGLLAELPDTAADRLLGKRAARQVPDARRRRELAVVLLRRKAGPKGDQARKALRAWRLLQAAAAARALPAQGLPASASLVADVVRTELQRAQREAKGSQGGCTVGGTIRDGFVWLQTVAKLPIEADSSLVEAAAARSRLLAIGIRQIKGAQRARHEVAGRGVLP